MDTSHLAIAVCIARVFLGILFVMQGYDKVFVMKMSSVVETFKAELGHTVIPSWLVVPAAWFSSCAELIGGIMLIVGIGKYYALTALGLDLILVAIAMGAIEPLWKMDFVFPRLILVLFLLAVPPGGDLFSLDHLLANMGYAQE